MEIRFSHVQTEQFNDLSFTIPSGVITGITGIGNLDFIPLLLGINKKSGTIYYDKVRRIKRNEISFYKKIKLVPKEFVKEFPYDNISEYFRAYLMHYGIKTTNQEEKIKSAIKIIGLDESILKKQWHFLATGEQKKVQLALALLSNPDVILLEDPFSFFDAKEVVFLMRILERLKDKFHKTIVIASDNADLLYQYTKYLLVVDQNKLVIEGMTENVYFNQTEKIRRCAKIPQIVEFIQYVEKRKNIKLDHRKDVKDVMKDIYRQIM